MLKSIDFWPLVPKKLSVESSINNDVHQKSMFKVGSSRLLTELFSKLFSCLHALMGRGHYTVTLF